MARTHRILTIRHFENLEKYMKFVVFLRILRFSGNLKKCSYHPMAAYSPYRGRERGSAAPEGAGGHAAVKEGVTEGM